MWGGNILNVSKIVRPLLQFIGRIFYWVCNNYCIIRVFIPRSIASRHRCHSFRFVCYRGGDRNVTLYDILKKRKLDFSKWIGIAQEWGRISLRGPNFAICKFMVQYFAIFGYSGRNKFPETILKMFTTFIPSQQQGR